MRNLILTREEFGKEIKVVMEERRLRTEDQPHSLLYEKLMAVAYQSHLPASDHRLDERPENMKAEDARAWYEAGMRPTTRCWW